MLLLLGVLEAEAPFREQLPLHFVHFFYAGCRYLLGCAGAWHISQSASGTCCHFMPQKKKKKRKNGSSSCCCSQSKRLPPTQVGAFKSPLKQLAVFSANSCSSPNPPPSPHSAQLWLGLAWLDCSATRINCIKARQKFCANSAGQVFGHSK